MAAVISRRLARAFTDPRCEYKHSLVIAVVKLSCCCSSRRNRDANRSRRRRTSPARVVDPPGAASSRSARASLVDVARVFRVSSFRRRSRAAPAPRASSVVVEGRASASSSDAPRVVDADASRAREARRVRRRRRVGRDVRPRRGDQERGRRRHRREPRHRPRVRLADPREASVQRRDRDVPRRDVLRRPPRAAGKLRRRAARGDDARRRGRGVHRLLGGRGAGPAVRCVLYKSFSPIARFQQLIASPFN